MLVPSMYDMPEVMARSGYTEEDIFDWGISGEIVFLVVVPEVGACRVPDVALSHFMAGADEYAIAGEMFPDTRPQALLDKLVITAVSALAHKHWQPPYMRGSDRDGWRLPDELKPEQ